MKKKPGTFLVFYGRAVAVAVAEAERHSFSILISGAERREEKRKEGRGALDQHPMITRWQKKTRGPHTPHVSAFCARIFFFFFPCLRRWGPLKSPVPETKKEFQ